jgi:leucyl-tRNA synthetase
MSQEYDHKKIESKWQEKWDSGNLYKTETESEKPKYYILDMFPYPSGFGLHVGHPKGYIASDIISRYKRMNGFNVLHPMGWDAFGLPAENFALKNKTHPREQTDANIKTYKEQLSIIGLDYDWSREIDTTDPGYYKWTQWIFLQLFKKGLAYESNEPINWCPSCKTGLANEDLDGNKCERCGSVVEKKPIRQWVLKIRDYADRLLDGLDDLDWPESIKTSQKNWIGRSEGLLFKSPVKDTNIEIETFSTHFEAFYADTFVVIAPDHPLLEKLVEGTENTDEVLEFAQKIVDDRAEKGYDEDKEPAGIFTGRYTIDLVGNGELPIWVSNYVLAEYGTGIVKASCHDERDFAFAKKYDIPMKPVLFPEDEEERKKVENLEVCYTDMVNGVLTEPKEFAGKKAGENRKEIAKHAVKNKLAEETVNYKLRDWVFSRQRYWGEPIPIIHCEKCGPVAVPEKDLPVILPDVESYEPTDTGESPLANIDEWVETKCPECGGNGRRETNTMPQWAGSSWYYLRYINPDNNEEIFNKELEKYWSPVDMYIGGAEHATRHLIYARFWHKFLYDIGVVNYKEPFAKLQHVGLINGEDGRKMSKRWGNVINPDDVVDTYGADTLRLFEMFLGPFDKTADWSTESIIGPRRFLEKVWRIRDFISEKESEKVTQSLHKTIKKVTDDIENIDFNTAISEMMTFANVIEGEKEITLNSYKKLLQLLAPFAPHMTEDIWNELSDVENDSDNTENSIHISEWPKYDESLIKDQKVTIGIQVNGKVRAEIEIAPDEPEDSVKKQVLDLPEIQKWTGDSEIKKFIYVPGKIISIVV